MKIARGTLLSRLHEAEAGLAVGQATVEQSTLFCFSGDLLTTFNGDVMVRAENPLAGIGDLAVKARTLLSLTSKIPDEELDVTLSKGKLIVRGKGRRAEMGVEAQVTSPTQNVPTPAKGHRLAEGCAHALRQAAGVCDPKGDTLAACVHVTPDRVEGCDNVRMLRVDGPTGFPEEVLIPATSVMAMEGLELTRVGVSGGWCHFTTAGGATISLASHLAKYHDGVDELVRMRNPVRFKLPSQLADIVGRAEVFGTGRKGEYDTAVSLELSPGQDGELGRLIVRSTEEGGTYRESRRIPYDGPVLEFLVSPRLLVELFKLSSDAMFSPGKMKVKVGAAQFVVLLHEPEPVNKLEKKVRAKAEPQEELVEVD